MQEIDHPHREIFIGLGIVRQLAQAGDRLRGRIIERLMCDFSVDLEALANKNELAAAAGFAHELQALNPLEAEGLVRRDGKRIVVTEKGRPFVRMAAAVAV